MQVRERIVLAIDVGSSSIRCSAYIINENNQIHVIEALEHCSAKQEARAVQPNSGRIHLKNEDDNHHATIFDQIDCCVDETLKLVRHRSDTSHVPIDIVGVGFSTFVMNLIGIDDNGQVIGEQASISYACNSLEASKYCQTLKRELDQDLLKALYQSTGAPLHSAYALVQLGTFYSNPNHHHDSQQRDHHHVAKWQTLASLCVARWLGISALRMPMSWSEASWTGIFNFTTCRYEPKALQLLPESCQQALPWVADFDGTRGDVNDEQKEVLMLLRRGIQPIRPVDSTPNPYWDRWPELRGCLSTGFAAGGDGIESSSRETDNDRTGCRLFLGVGDGACANLGSKCSDTSRIAVTIGTSAAARVCFPLAVNDNCDEVGAATFRVPRGLFCYRINQSHVLLGGALTDGGSVVEWVSSLTNLTTTTAMNDCMAQVDQLLQSAYAGSTSNSDHDAAATPLLTVVPFLSGERSTGFRDGATGAILGLTRETTAAHLLKACLEGVTLRIHAIVSLIQTVLGGHNRDDEPVQIVTSGKSLEVNHVWRQMLADCTGLKVVWDEDVQEGTSRGVALLVAMSLRANPHVTKSFPQEALSSNATTVSQPSIFGATQEYWKRAADSQEQLIHAVTPLYNTTA